MNKGEIKFCPGNLSEGFDTYSNTSRKNLFNGKKVSHILSFDEPEIEDANLLKSESELGEMYYLEILQKKNKLFTLSEGQSATHIIKICQKDIKNTNDILPNEHLTTQIASQVYNINVAPNALIWFKNKKISLITKKFNTNTKGEKILTINFNSIIDSNLDSNFEMTAEIIKQYVPAWKIEIEKYFSNIIFHYIFGNTSFNPYLFSLIESQLGDLILSPASNLINSSYHISPKSNPVKGLFADNFQSEESKQSGKIHRNDFVEFGKRIGVTEKRIEKLLIPFCVIQPKVELLVSNSYVSNSLKRNYLLDYNTKINYLSMPLSTIEQIRKTSSTSSNLFIPFDDL